MIHMVASPIGMALVFSTNEDKETLIKHLLAMPPDKKAYFVYNARNTEAKVEKEIELIRQIADKQDEGQLR